MAEIPEKLEQLLEDFDFVDDRNERAALLIEMADKFEEVPERIATRPFPTASSTIGPSATRASSK